MSNEGTKGGFQYGVQKHF